MKSNDKESAYTRAVVREAMRIVSPYVRSPKCVRDGLVTPNKKSNVIHKP